MSNQSNIQAASSNPQPDAPAAAVHPRLFFSPDDIPQLRQRVQRPPYRDMLAAIRAELQREDQRWARGEHDENDRLYDRRPRNLASLYILTGDPAFARRAQTLTMEIVELRSFADPRYKGLSRAAAALTVAIAYDLCHDAWSAEARTRVSDRLYEVSRSMGQSMGRGANNSLANNWAAVRYAGMGIAGLASDHPNGLAQARWAYPNLIRHLNANLGDNGWNPEGIGYTLYPWQFTGPFGIAAHRAGVGDLRKDGGAKVRMTLWTTVAGTIPIEASAGRRGLRADLANDHPAWSSLAMGFAFHYLPQSHRPALKWMFDRLCGEQGDQTYASDAGLGLLAVLLYPGDIDAVDPAQIDGVGKHYVDRSHGLVIFRNQYADENDIVATVCARARPSNGGHSGPTTNTFRILGLGGAFAVGGGRTGDTNGQTNLFPGDPPSRAARGYGRLESHQLEDHGGGTAVVTGSCMGVQNHTRRFAVDYSGQSGAPAVFISAETSDNGRLWRLNTPGANTITHEANRFVITAPNGASLVGVVLTPEAPSFQTGEVRRGGTPGHTGYPYRGTDYQINRYVQFECDRNVLVVMTLQNGQPPRVTLESANANADSDAAADPTHVDIRIGSMAVQIRGRDITFNPPSP